MFYAVSALSSAADLLIDLLSANIKRLWLGLGEPFCGRKSRFAAKSFSMFASAVPFTSLRLLCFLHMLHAVSRAVEIEN